jgi:hypothetical protein
MRFYEPLQRLDYTYIRKEKERELWIYVRSSVTVYLPAGVILSNSISGRSPLWTLDFYPYINNSGALPYNFEKMELIFVSRIPLPKETDPKILESVVIEEIKNLLGDTRLFTVTCNVYNERRTLEGQVTNTISNQGEVVIV